MFNLQNVCSTSLLGYVNMIRMLARVGILFHFVDDSDLRHIELTIIFKLDINNFLCEYY